MEYARNIESLVEDMDAEIIISDDQSDKEPVLIFTSGGKRMGYISVVELQKWINYII